MQWTTDHGQQATGNNQQATCHVPPASSKNLYPKREILSSHKIPESEEHSNRALFGLENKWGNDRILLKYCYN